MTDIIDTIPEKFRTQPQDGCVRVLQSSDWHIGGDFSIGQGKKLLRRSRMLEYVEQLPEIAHRCHVDVVLLPGDLFQNRDVEIEEVERTMSAIAMFAPIPVIIAAGNHDPLDALSQYNRRLSIRSAKIDQSLPIVLAGDQWQRLEFDRFSVCSKSFISHAVQSISPFSDLPKRGIKPIELICIHGSLGDVPSGQTRTAPITESEIEQSNYDYVALGHYHRGKEYWSKSGKMKAAYSGSLGVLRRSDLGETGILLLDIESGGVTPDNWCRIRLDPTRIFSVSIPIKATESELLTEVLQQLNALGCTRTDIVRITVTGRAFGELRKPPQTTLSDICAFCEWIDETESPWDMVSLSEGKTTEAKFVRTMLTRLQETREQGNQESSKVIQDALDLALQALHFNRIQYPPQPQPTPQMPNDTE